MTTVFDTFSEVEMEYLTISRGTVSGNQIVDSKTISGLFKLRLGQTGANNMENLTSTATAHVHPEDFDDWNNLVGNGISFGGVDYEIVGVTAGANFATGAVEHLTLTLEVAEYVDDRESE